MDVRFSFEIGSMVNIVPLNVRGIVIGAYYGETGEQFQVAYFLDGERKVQYLYPSELSSLTGTESFIFTMK